MGEPGGVDGEPGSEGAARRRRAAPACRLPDVVLMDLHMPQLDGIAATRRLAEALPSTAVIGLSAYEDPALRREARQAGAGHG